MTKEFISVAIADGLRETSLGDGIDVIFKQHHKDIAKLWYIFICILVVFCCVFAAAKQPDTIVIHDKVNCSTCAQTTDRDREVEERCKSQFIKIVKTFGDKYKNFKKDTFSNPYIDKKALLNYLNTDTSDFFLQEAVDNDKLKYFNKNK